MRVASVALRGGSCRRMFWAALLLVMPAAGGYCGHPSGVTGVTSAYLHIAETMDMYHTSFDIYSDIDAGGDHIGRVEVMCGPDSAARALSFQQACTLGVHSGLTCIALQYEEDSADWVAVRLSDSSGHDLTGATMCSFWARGGQGGEVVRFEVGGAAGDSVQRGMTVTLTSDWQWFSVDLTGVDVSDLKGLFGAVIDRASNPAGCEVYLDDISYDLARLEQPRFIQSTTPAVYYQDRFVPLNKASTEGNALAMVALVARGQSDDLRRARLIGDAFQYCQTHDRYYTDGRLRNAYRTGDIADHSTGKALLTGWWHEDSVALRGLVVRQVSDRSRWEEDDYQVGSNAGEMAWVIIAWLSYDSASGEHRYRENAVSLGQWIVDNCYDASGVAGYTGGFWGAEPAPTPMPWKSVVHNANLCAAFRRLFDATGDSTWLTHMDRAYAFISAMWSPTLGRFWNGTSDASRIDSTGFLQAQVKTILATRDTAAYRGGIDWVLANCLVDTLGYSGFHYGTVRDGIWWEGVGQACCALQMTGDTALASSYRGQLESWQSSAIRGNLKGIVACVPDVIYTGVESYWGSVVCYARLDLNATCWYIFASGVANPYWDVPSAGVLSCAQDHGALRMSVSPSPFSGRTYVAYDVPRSAAVSVVVYDDAGRLVKVLQSSRLPPGTHRACWDGADESGRPVPPGVYLCRVSDGIGALQGKVVFLGR